MTGAWLWANDLKQISDCTGGRIGDAVRYCKSEQVFPVASYFPSASLVEIGQEKGK